MGATYISESPQWECVTQATGKNKLKRKNSGRSCILPNPWSCLKPNQKRSFQFHEYSTNFCETVLCDAWKCSSFFSVKLHKGTDGILLKVSRESKEEVSVYAERVTCAYFKKNTKKNHPTFFLNPNVQNLTPSSSPPATVSASAVLPHYISISITSYCSITSPPAPKVPSSQKHTGIPISASCFIPTAASLQPPAKLNGLYWRQGSHVCSIQLSSAGLQAL